MTMPFHAEMRNKYIVDIAKEIATEAHQGQFRKDRKTPYIEHPKEVVNGLIFYLMEDIPDYVLASAWLHDVVEDTNFNSSQIADRFLQYNKDRTTINKIIETVLNLTRTEEKTPEGRLDYLDKIRNGDFWVHAIKLCDVYHNSLTLSQCNQKTVDNIIRESIHFYLPLASNPKLKGVGDGIKCNITRYIKSL